MTAKPQKAGQPGPLNVKAKGLCRSVGPKIVLPLEEMMVKSPENK